MTAIDLEGTEDIEHLSALLNATESSDGICQFRSWEILHEIERQQRRREYDKRPERRVKRRERDVQQVLIKGYISTHPNEVATIAKKHGV